VPKARAIPGRESGSKLTRLLIEEDGKFGPAQEKQEQEQEKATRAPLLVQKPIRFGYVPETTPQAAVEVLLSFWLVLCHCSHGQPGSPAQVATAAFMPPSSTELARSSSGDRATNDALIESAQSK
jgi:hypothetical protein